MLWLYENYVYVGYENKSHSGSNTIITMDIFDLPVDILHHTAKFLENEEIILLSMTCRYMLDIFKGRTKCKAHREYFTRSMRSYDILLELDPVKQCDDFPHAVRNGNLELAQLLAPISNTEYRASELFTDAIGIGGLDIIQWNVDCGYIITDADAQDAASQGYLDIVVWIASKGGVDWNRVLNNAARHGHLHILQYAHSNSIFIDPGVYFRAVQGCHRDIIDWIESNPVEPYPDEVRKSEQLLLRSPGSIFVWVFGRVYTLQPCSYFLPLKRGDIDMLNFIMNKGVPLHGNYYARSMMKKDTKSLDWLKSVNCPRRTSDMFNNKYRPYVEYEMAIKFGGPESVEWLMENNFPCNRDVLISEPVIQGNLGVLKMLKEKGFQFRLNLCLLAIANKHPNILKYLLENGAPFDKVKLMEEYYMQFVDPRRMVTVSFTIHTMEAREIPFFLQRATKMQLQIYRRIEKKNDEYRMRILEIIESHVPTPQ